MIEKRLRTSIVFLIYLTFFVPIIVIPQSFIFPFVAPKVLVFRILVELILAIYLILLLINKDKYRPHFKILGWTISAFLLSFTISTFTGLDRYRSFWDSSERMLGLFTMLHYFVYFVVCSSVFKTWNDWKWALRAFLIGGSVVMFIGLLQVIYPHLLLNQLDWRISSTLGSPVYVGGYSLFLFFAAALLFMRDHSKVWRGVYGVFATLALLALFYSSSRGALLGLVVGSSLTLVGYGLFLKERPRLKKLTWISLAIIAVTVLLIYFFRHTNFVSHIPTVGRAVNTSLSDFELSPRWMAWQIAYESFLEKPLFGWGPNNFVYAFNLHYNPQLLNFGIGETWFDNAHNIILNTLAVQGILGLVTYLGIFGGAIGTLYWAFKKRELNINLFIVGSAFLIAHLTQNFTVFENPTSYLYFMVWLAMLSSLTSNAMPLQSDAAKEVTTEPTVRWSLGLSLIVISAVTMFTIFFFNIQPWRADNMAARAITMLNQNPVNGITAAERALASKSPHIDDIRGYLATATIGLLINKNNILEQEKSTQLFNIIHSALLANTILHPLDIRNDLALSQLLYFEAQRTRDSRYLLRAEYYSDKALQNSPGRQQVIYNLAMLKFQLGKTDAAIKLFESAVAENNKICESYRGLAYIYKATKQPQKAKEILQLAAQNKALCQP